MSFLFGVLVCLLCEQARLKKLHWDGKGEPRLIPTCLLFFAAMAPCMDYVAFCFLVLLTLAGTVL